ncbi:MAG: twin-arginine translocation signal domain-containing protein, partial [Chlorobiaceae bacterium]
MERRAFIKKLFVGTGVGVGVAVAGSAGLIGYYQPRKAWYGREVSGGKERVGGLKKVVVIGG